MDKFEAVEALVQEITEEAANFKNATDPNEEVEACLLYTSPSPRDA